MLLDAIDTAGIEPIRFTWPPRHPRGVVDGILWILRTDAQWQDLPARYPPKSTCQRWRQQWSTDVFFDDILFALAEDPRDRCGFDSVKPSLTEPSFPPKRGPGVGNTKRGNRAKIMAITDRHGLPVVLHVDSARPHEMKLVGKPLEGRFLVTLPKRLIGDKADDSDPIGCGTGCVWHQDDCAASARTEKR